MNTLLIGAVLGLIVGFLGNKLIERHKFSKQIEDSNEESKRILEIAKREAESLKKNKIIQAKEKFLELKAEHEKFIFTRENKIKNIESKILEKEKEISSQLSQQKNLTTQLKSNTNDYENALEIIDIKDYANDKHKSVDEPPFGGGSGMVMRADILADCLDKNISDKKETIISTKKTIKDLVIFVDDNGPGIPEKEYAKVIKPFYRIDESRGQNKSGVGLGLSIANDIVRSHGGNIL